MLKSKKQIVILGILALGTQLMADDNSWGLYGKVTLVTPQADLRVYSGGKSSGHGFEMGKNWGDESQVITFGAYVGYNRLSGNYRPEIDTALGLDWWRFGIDTRFATPIKAMTVYAGLSANFFDGYRYQNSSVLGLKGGFPDSKAKFGARLGIQYTISGRWGVSMDYNFAEWRSDIAPAPAIKGVNPVNPSWVATSVVYQF